MFEAEPLDLRDLYIISTLPAYGRKEIFTVGAGHGRLEWHLAKKYGYKVIASDIEKQIQWKEDDSLKFVKYNILNYAEKFAPVVICSQVLEHIRDYRIAFINLLMHTEIRLILTFPYKRSFYSSDHINFWDEKNIREFLIMAAPFRITIAKKITKEADKKYNKWVYLLTVTKKFKNECI